MRNINLTINSKSIPVELALTPQDKIVGLNNRPKIAPNTGMLFDFTDEDKPVMTMEKMLYALDIIFIKDDKVVDIVTAQPGELGVTSLEKFNKVLEVLPNTFLHKYLKGAKVYHAPYELKPTPKFAKGGQLKSAPDYDVKVDDIPLDPSAMQVLDEKGEVVTNLKVGARIFSRVHTLALIEAHRDKDHKKLAKVFLEALDKQDTQKQEYTDGE